MQSRPIYTPDLLVKTMQTFKEWHNQNQPRQFNQQPIVGVKETKCIIIEDSHRIYTDAFNKKSNLISGRNPFRRDETVIDYDMDSEDEWAEENGEDLDKKAGDEDEDEEM